jgi:hypothetical protein
MHPGTARRGETDIMIRHRARLPLGYTAEFQWDPDRRHLGIEWSPRMPRIESPRHRRRLLEAYVGARAEFLEMVAASLGGGVAVVDLDGDHTRTSVVRQPVKH